MSLFAAKCLVLCPWLCCLWNGTRVVCECNRLSFGFTWSVVMSGFLIKDRDINVLEWLDSIWHICFDWMQPVCAKAHHQMHFTFKACINVRKRIKFTPVAVAEVHNLKLFLQGLASHCDPHLLAFTRYETTPCIFHKLFGKQRSQRMCSAFGHDVKALAAASRSVIIYETGLWKKYITMARWK